MASDGTSQIILSQDEIIIDIIKRLNTIREKDQDKHQECLAKLLGLGYGFSVIAALLSTEMSIGDRTYSVLLFHEKHEFAMAIDGIDMRNRGEKYGASMDKEHGEYILKYQDQIPVVFRGVIHFVFPNWLSNGRAACIVWRPSDDRWDLRFLPIDKKVWRPDGRFVRLILPAA